MRKALRTFGPVCAISALVAVLCGEVYAWPVDNHPLPLLGFPVGLFGTLIVSCVASTLVGAYFVPRDEPYDIYAPDDPNELDEDLPNPTRGQIGLSCLVGVGAGVLGALYHHLFQDGSHAGFVATILVASMGAGCLGTLFAPPLEAATAEAPAPADDAATEEAPAAAEDAAPSAMSEAPGRANAADPTG